MKKRLDMKLFDDGMVLSRERAKGLIMAGKVFVNDQKTDKAGFMVGDLDKLEIRGQDLKYVSRGGLKLEKAINLFKIDIDQKICMDVGASTGGFTDCMLQNGAAKVYAVDVGYGQLAWSLRNDPRVINLERTNVRYLSRDIVQDEINFVSVDVSFISLNLVLPSIKNLLKPGGELICLIKPQFEAGRDKIGKKGVVRDIDVHLEVVKKIAKFSQEVLLFSIINLDYSPIKGPEGNIEYLIYMKYSTDQTGLSISDLENKIYSIVRESHNNL